MDKALLDTDAFSEVIKAKNVTVRKNASTYRRVHGRYTISVITVMEMVSGYRRMNRRDQAQRLVAGLSAEEVLPFEHDSAVLAGEIFGELQRSGQPIGRGDPMIAAIAVQDDLVLVTGNTKHFDRIRQLGFPLSIVDWHE
jgi:tRNA(fMet)-specific endonuclease VapC